MSRRGSTGLLSTNKLNSLIDSHPLEIQSCFPVYGRRSHLVFILTHRRPTNKASCAASVVHFHVKKLWLLFEKSCLVGGAILTALSSTTVHETRFSNRMI